jgi:hypothetical protein
MNALTSVLIKLGLLKEDRVQVTQDLQPMSSLVHRPLPQIGNRALGVQMS